MPDFQHLQYTFFEPASIESMVATLGESRSTLSLIRLAWQIVDESGDGTRDGLNATEGLSQMATTAEKMGTDESMGYIRR